MDQNLQVTIEKRMERTIKALKKNQFDAHVINSREELMRKLQEYMPEGCSCSVGGSMTLFECGIIDHLRSGRYNFLDRYAEGVNTKEIFRQSFLCDVYLSSVNAITEDGKLYNMDGNGNRVAAISYGPDKVIIVAGYNKIVHDIDDARARNREISGPANAQRLGKEKNACFHTGKCGDCLSETRFCCHEVVHHFQMNKNRIVVLLLGEQLGY